MNIRKVVSCFIAAVLILMTCTLCGCRKKDGEVGDGSDHMTTATPNATGSTAAPTDNIGGDIKDDIEDDIVDPIKSMMPDAAATANP